MNTLSQLSSDWWTKTHTVEVLSQWLKRHVLALFVAYKKNNQNHYYLFTGFVIERNGNVIWVTAGHVIDHIEKIRTDSGAIITTMQWIDEHDGSSDVPFHVHHRDFKVYSATTDDIDIGIGLLTGLDAGCIQNNDDLGIITDQAWKNLIEATPEGYYLIGYPAEWVKISKKRKSISQVVRSFTLNMSCIPIKPKNWNDLEYHEGIWSDPDAFYGQIVPFPEKEEKQPFDISGMSGGPVLSIERTSDERLAYRLVGIQASWLDRSRIIRAEPILRFVEMIDGWVDNLTT